MGEAASLTAGPKFVKGQKSGHFLAHSGQRLVFDLCLHVQLVWESSNFTGSSVPLIESLKSKAHLITDAWKRKNLTHLQRVLLFKDSSGTGLLREKSGSFRGAKAHWIEDEHETIPKFRDLDLTQKPQRI